MKRNSSNTAKASSSGTNKRGRTAKEKNSKTTTQKGREAKQKEQEYKILLQELINQGAVGAAHPGNQLSQESLARASRMAGNILFHGFAGMWTPSFNLPSFGDDFSSVWMPPTNLPKVPYYHFPGRDTSVVSTWAAHCIREDELAKSMNCDKISYGNPRDIGLRDGKKFAELVSQSPLGVELAKILKDMNRDVSDLGWGIQDNLVFALIRDTVADLTVAEITVGALFANFLENCGCSESVKELIGTEKGVIWSEDKLPPHLRTGSGDIPLKIRISKNHVYIVPWNTTQESEVSSQDEISVLYVIFNSGTDPTLASFQDLRLQTSKEVRSFYPSVNYASSFISAYLQCLFVKFYDLSSEFNLVFGPPKTLVTMNDTKPQTGHRDRSKGSLQVELGENFVQVLRSADTQFGTVNANSSLTVPSYDLPDSYHDYGPLQLDIITKKQDDAIINAYVRQLGLAQGSKAHTGWQVFWQAKKSLGKTKTGKAALERCFNLPEMYEAIMKRETIGLDSFLISQASIPHKGAPTMTTNDYIQKSKESKMRWSRPHPPMRFCSQFAPFANFYGWRLFPRLHFCLENRDNCCDVKDWAEVTDHLGKAKDNEATYILDVMDGQHEGILFHDSRPN